MNTFLGVLVKELRERKGISQEKLARDCDVSTSYISKLEVGQRVCGGREFLGRLASVLGVEHDELLMLSGKMPMSILQRCQSSLFFVRFIIWAYGHSDSALDSMMQRSEDEKN